MDTEILRTIGLTNAQTKVYLALLELGECQAGEIIKKSKMPSSVVYNATNQLIDRGLVTFVIKGKIKRYSPADPSALVELAKDTKEKIEMIVPALRAKQTHTLRPEARVFAGWKGIYNAFNLVLEKLPKGGEYIGFAGGVQSKEDKKTKTFFQELQKKRALKRLRVRFIANESARKRIATHDYYKKFGKPEFRYLPEYVPIGVVIFGNNVMNYAFEKEPIAVITTSRAIANSYRRSFKAMWAIGKN